MSNSCEMMSDAGQVKEKDLGVLANAKFHWAGDGVATETVR
jgi:hypothetical protein